MTKQDPTEPLRKLQAAVKRVTAPLGVRLKGFQFALTEGNEDIVSLRFEVSPDKLVKASTVEQKQYDDLFDSIIDGIDFNDPPPEQGLELEEWEE